MKERRQFTDSEKKRFVAQTVKEAVRTAFTEEGFTVTDISPWETSIRWSNDPPRYYRVKVREAL